MFGVNWEHLKSFVDTRGLSIQFVELSDKYLLWAESNEFKLTTPVYITSPRNSDQIDFEDNGYKAGGNIPFRISVGNGSTSPLLANGIFTGAISPVGDANTLIISINSNIVSASAGVQVFWYLDQAGTQLLKLDAFTYYNVNFGATLKPTVKGSYFKVVYTNGGTNQTFFRLLTTFARNPLPATAANGQSIIFPTSEASLVRPVNDRLYLNGQRTFVKKTLAAALVVSPGTIIHTVTATKTFYLTSYQITAISGSATVPQFVLQDGTDAADQIPFIFQPQPALAIQGFLQASQAMERVPIPFTTDVRAIEVAGDVTAHICLIGYEE